MKPDWKFLFVGLIMVSALTGCAELKERMKDAYRVGQALRDKTFPSASCHPTAEGEQKQKEVMDLINHRKFAEAEAMLLPLANNDTCDGRQFMFDLELVYGLQKKLDKTIELCRKAAGDDDQKFVENVHFQCSLLGKAHHWCTLITLAEKNIAFNEKLDKPNYSIMGKDYIWKAACHNEAYKCNGNPVDAEKALADTQKALEIFRAHCPNDCDVQPMEEQERALKVALNQNKQIDAIKQKQSNGQ